MSEAPRIIDSLSSFDYAFTFQLYPDVTIYKRAIYGPLDFLGDVGGLADALFSIGKALIFLFQLTYGSKLSRYLLENIFQADNSY